MPPNRREQPKHPRTDRQDIRRAAEGPDGMRYEVVGTVKDWKLGTGSVVVDVAAFLWALVRQARGKEWVVEVRAVGTKSQPILTRRFRTRDQAAASVTDLANAVARGEITPSVE